MNKTKNFQGQMTEVKEPHDALIKLSPVITNLCISLMVMAFFAICFHS